MNANQHSPAGENPGTGELVRGANPHGKALLLCELAEQHGLRTLVETGIYQGQGSGLMALERGLVDRYIVIDTDPAMREQGAETWCGDSGALMPHVLRDIHAPALFWLDAHEPDSCPLLAELDAITAWPYAAQSVLAIDDLRMMEDVGWPTRALLEERLEHRWVTYERGDILICEPL